MVRYSIWNCSTWLDLQMIESVHAIDQLGKYTLSNYTISQQWKERTKCRRCLSVADLSTHSAHTFYVVDVDVAKYIHTHTHTVTYMIMISFPKCMFIGKHAHTHKRCTHTHTRSSDYSIPSNKKNNTNNNTPYTTNPFS